MKNQSVKKPRPSGWVTTTPREILTGKLLGITPKSPTSIYHVVATGGSGGAGDGWMLEFETASQARQIMPWLRSFARKLNAQYKAQLNAEGEQ
jgi:hypothetical protein